jgi:DNA processing protein
MWACDACMRRTWLLQRVSGFLEYQRKRVDDILSLEDRTLIEFWLEISERRGLHDEIEREYAEFGAAECETARARADAAEVDLICACSPDYPERLRRLFGPPAVLHVAGGMRRFLELAAADPVAVVGTRRPTLYGTDMASRVGRGVSVSGMTVVSGMALGIDAAAHRGALAGGGRTIAVLPGCASVPYPKENRQLYNQILRNGVAVSELAIGASVWKWSLIARNRIIAALSELTIVVQGRTWSGALKTATLARNAGCRVGAVPGSALVPQSEGPHKLLREGAVLVRDSQDVLDAVCGVGARAAVDPVVAALSPEGRAVLAAIRGGANTVAELSRAEVADGPVLALLAELELAGCIRRVAGGRYSVIV